IKSVGVVRATYTAKPAVNADHSISRRYPCAATSYLVPAVALAATGCPALATPSIAQQSPQRATACLFDTTTESQSTEIAQIIFGQPLIAKTKGRYVTWRT